MAAALQVPVVGFVGSRVPSMDSEPAVDPLGHPSLEIDWLGEAALKVRLNLSEYTFRYTISLRGATSLQFTSASDTKFSISSAMTRGGLAVTLTRLPRPELNVSFFCLKRPL